MVRPGKNNSLDCFNSKMVAQTVKNLPAMQETQVRSLSQEDPWRREWQRTPVFFPEESRGQRSLVGYSPWGRKESDMTEQRCAPRGTEGGYVYI